MVNQVTIMGNIAKEPLRRVTQNGKVICDLRFAVNEFLGGKERAMFFSAKLFDKIAETVLANCHTGDKVLLTGRLSINDWTDNDGNNHHDIYIIASSCEFLSPKKPALEGAVTLEAKVAPKTERKPARAGYAYRKEAE